MNSDRGEKSNQILFIFIFIIKKDKFIYVKRFQNLYVHKLKSFLESDVFGLESSKCLLSLCLLVT